ncbi:MAG: helix-turn-helix transcriptional regulator [Erysipelotrichaceae bacterium]|nr:helix-turn-helix transcriptional regulator [Erysipelotrichaceae bacterium]
MDGASLGVVITVGFILFIIIVFVFAGSTKDITNLNIKGLYLGSNLLYLRIKMNLTAEEVSINTGIKLELIKNMENEIYMPTLSELDKLASYFNLKREELVYRDLKFENKDWYITKK